MIFLIINSLTKVTVNMGNVVPNVHQEEDHLTKATLPYMYMYVWYVLKVDWIVITTPHFPQWLTS